jgi:hypothetical protein
MLVANKALLLMLANKFVNHRAPAMAAVFQQNFSPVIADFGSGASGSAAG